jgi:hypothetical protein
MKKINLLLSVTISVIMISCGGKSNNKEKAEETDKKEVKVTDCICSEISGLDAGKGITKIGSKDLYTGSCIEKDQNDSIVRKVEIKNGWLIREILREKIQKDYVTTKDWQFENGKIMNGFEIKFDQYQNNPNYNFISEYSEYKNGIYGFNSWKVDLNELSPGGAQSVSAIITKKNGVDYYSNDERSKPKCLTNPEFNMTIWLQNDISPEETSKILNCLKGELTHFNYWKIK